MAGRQKILNIDPDIEDSKDNNNFEFAKPLCGLHSSCLPRLAYRSSISDEPNFTLPTHNLPPSTSESIPNELRTAQTPSTGPAIDWKYALSNRNISHATHLHPFAHSRHPHGLGTGDILRRETCVGALRRMVLRRKCVYLARTQQTFNPAVQIIAVDVCAHGLKPCGSDEALFSASGISRA